MNILSTIKWLRIGATAVALLTAHLAAAPPRSMPRLTRQLPGHRTPVGPQSRMITFLPVSIGSPGGPSGKSVLTKDGCLELTVLNLGSSNLTLDIELKAPLIDDKLLAEEVEPGPVVRVITVSKSRIGGDFLGAVKVTFDDPDNEVVVIAFNWTAGCGKGVAFVPPRTGGNEGRRNLNLPGAQYGDLAFVTNQGSATASFAAFSGNADGTVRSGSYMFGNVAVDSPLAYKLAALPKNGKGGPFYGEVDGDGVSVKLEGAKIRPPKKKGGDLAVVPGIAIVKGVTVLRVPNSERGSGKLKLVFQNTDSKSHVIEIKCGMISVARVTLAGGAVDDKKISGAAKSCSDKTPTKVPRILTPGTDAVAGASAIATFEPAPRGAARPITYTTIPLLSDDGAASRLAVVFGGQITNASSVTFVAANVGAKQAKLQVTVRRAGKKVLRKRFKVAAGETVEMVLPHSKVSFDDYYVETKIKRSLIWTYLVREDAATRDVSIIPGHSLR